MNQFAARFVLPFLPSCRNAAVRLPALRGRLVRSAVSASAFLALLFHGAPALAANAVVSTCDQAHLQTALTTANNPPGGTVTFSCTGTIPLTSNLAPYYVNDNVSMVVDGGNHIVLDGGNTYAFWQVYGGASLTLKNLTLQHAGTLGAPGHAIQSFGQLTLDAVNVNNNHPAASVIDIESGTAKVRGSTFSGNAASGSVIYNKAGTTVENSTFSGNSLALSGGSGAAINNDGGSVSVTGTTFSNNSVSGNGYGGAINNNSGTLNVSGSTFNANYAFDGGAVENVGGSVASIAHIVHSTFTGNTASYGRAIENFDNSNGSEVDADYDSFISNQSTNIGGAIWVEGGTVETSWSDFANNKASTQGGAIECDSGHLYVERNTFSGNASNSGNTSYSNYGGAIYSSCYLVVAESTFYGNSAQGSEGGALYQSGTKYAGVFFSTFVSNTAQEGAAMSGENGASLGLQDSILATNTHGHTCAGAIASFGYNLADDSDCGGALSDPTDKPNVTLTMGSLINNGGPTPTIMPATGNPAINNIPTAETYCTIQKTDQRGYTRPAGTGCDSGAVEVGATDVIFQNGFEQ